MENLQCPTVESHLDVAACQAWLDQAESSLAEMRTRNACAMAAKAFQTEPSLWGARLMDVWEPAWGSVRERKLGARMLWGQGPPGAGKPPGEWHPFLFDRVQVESARQESLLGIVAPGPSGAARWIVGCLAKGRAIFAKEVLVEQRAALDGFASALLGHEAALRWRIEREVKQISEQSWPAASEPAKTL